MIRIRQTPVVCTNEAIGLSYEEIRKETKRDSQVNFKGYSLTSGTPSTESLKSYESTSYGEELPESTITSESLHDGRLLLGVTELDESVYCRCQLCLEKQEAECKSAFKYVKLLERIKLKKKIEILEHRRRGEPWLGDRVPVLSLIHI